MASNEIKGLPKYKDPPPLPLKRVLRLDKNYHLYIHGDPSKVEWLEDEKGKYLKIYFVNAE